MVTIESLTKIGLYSWKLKFSSELEEPTFYIYLDGNLIAETEQTEYDIAINVDEGSVIEILDNADEQPMQIFPGRLRLGWFFVEGTDYYRIDEYVGAAWVERYRMPENNGFLQWRSRFLEDGQTHIFRIVPVGTNGNEGTAKQFAVLMCRRPDVPDAGYSYNAGAQKVIISDNNSPPNDLINHCVAHYKMNDNAPNTTVIDSMKNSDGTAQQNTEDLHTDSGNPPNLNGALSFNGTSDYISVVGVSDWFTSDFSCACWIKTNDGQKDPPNIIFHQGEEGPSDTISFIITGNGKLQIIYNVSLVSLSLLTDVLFADGVSDWHFIVLTCKQVGDDVYAEIFFDGISVKSGTKTEMTMALYNTGEPLLLGALVVLNEYLDGTFDNTMFFNKALLQEDVDFLYNGGNGREDW